MNDEQTIRRGQQARQAMDYLGPVLDGLTDKAVADLLNAGPDYVLQRQLYAKALAEVRKTIEAHVRDGEFVASVKG
jgi:hypothetical protein